MSNEVIAAIVGGLIGILGSLAIYIAGYFLSRVGKITTYLTSSDFRVARVNESGEEKHDISITEAEWLSISLGIDIYNSSDVPKSLRELEIEVKSKKAVVSKTPFSVESNGRHIFELKIINLTPKVIGHIELETTLAKEELVGIVAVQDEWRLPNWLEGSLFNQVLVARLLPPSKLFQLATLGQAQSMLPAILGLTQGIASVVSGILVILILSLYWIVNKNHFERLWLSLLPSGQRKQARDIWQTIEPELGAYIRSQVIHSLLAGVLLGLGYWVIGSPYPMLLALAGTLACLIPFVGVVLAVIIPMLVGVLAGMPYTLLMVAYTLAVMIALGLWVKPRLFYRRWDNPILTLVILIALANAFGLLGILVAPPLSAICQILWNLLVNQRIASGAVVQNTDFKQRQENVWATIKIMDEPPPPMVFNTMERLTLLIEKAESILHPAQTTDSSDSLLPNSPQPDRE